MKRSGPLKRHKSLRCNSYAEAVARMRAPLRRKPPCKPRKPLGAPMRRTPLRKVSKSQARRIAKYRPIAHGFLLAHPICGICLVRGGEVRPSTEIHHIRGRNGPLLFDTRFFCASCRACRLWPHDNKEEARKLGVLAERGEWGSPVHVPKG